MSPPAAQRGRGRPWPTRGDRLTGADVRAALGSYTLDGSVWVPTTVDLRGEEQIEPPAPVRGTGESYGEDEIDI